MDHFADRLLQAIEEKGAPVCVGLDPVSERLPTAIKGSSPLARIGEFCNGVIEAVAPEVGCIKIQSACFERYGWEGVKLCEEIIARAKSLGVIVILDAKRGDIGASSEHYAAGLLAAEGSADALTVNSYLGADGIEPFIKTCAAHGKGLFALVRTSNPGGDALQSQPLTDGRSVADVVAGIIAQAGASHMGKRGYSLLGAVVGATKVADAGRLRALMPQQIFLVPGFGAQGGKADDVKACFTPGSTGIGAIITASRSVLYPPDLNSAKDWRSAVAHAAVEMKKEVVAAIS